MGKRCKHFRQPVGCQCRAPGRASAPRGQRQCLTRPSVPGTQAERQRPQLVAATPSQPDVIPGRAPFQPANDLELIPGELVELPAARLPKTRILQGRVLPPGMRAGNLAIHALN